MNLEKRLSRLEDIVEKHLEQSGYIHTDIAWLKRAFWVLAGGGVTFNITLAVGLLLHFLNK